MLFRLFNESKGLAIDVCVQQLNANKWYVNATFAGKNEIFHMPNFLSPSKEDCLLKAGIWAGQEGFEFYRSPLFRGVA